MTPRGGPDAEGLLGAPPPPCAAAPRGGRSAGAAGALLLLRGRCAALGLGLGGPAAAGRAAAAVLLVCLVGFAACRRFSDDAWHASPHAQAAGRGEERWPPPVLGAREDPCEGVGCSGTFEEAPSKWQVVLAGPVVVRIDPKLPSLVIGRKWKCDVVVGTEQENQWLKLSDEPGYIKISIENKELLRAVPAGKDRLDGSCEPCVDPGVNCSASRCCKWAGMSCYEKDAAWASCKATCTRGPDPNDADGNPWSCRHLGAATAGKALYADTPKSEWVESKCSKPGENCKDTMCCAWDGFRCFEKTEGYANCRKSCIPGPDPSDTDDTSWTCKALGSRTPGEGITMKHRVAAWAKDKCSGPGENCSTTRCCAARGMQCYEKGGPNNWAACRANCIPGPDLNDVNDHPWTCKALGTRTPGEAAYGESNKVGSWVRTNCSQPGEDCLKTQCCAWAGLQCYKKNANWGTCKDTCQRNKPDPDDPDGEAWSCETIGPRTPGPHSDDWDPWTEAKMYESELRCPACTSSQSSDKLEVVIPFFERDICKLKYLAKSISLHDPDGILGDVHLLWVSKQSPSGYHDDIKEIKASILESRGVSFTDLSEALSSSEIGGWFAQQVVKLKVASQVQSNYYIVMDSKNIIVRDIKREMFFTSCNQARMQAKVHQWEMGKDLEEGYKSAASLFKVGPPDQEFWPEATTPFLMHRRTVLDMLTVIGERPDIQNICDGPLCEKIGAKSNSGRGATCLTLYTMYVYRKAKLECIHTVENGTSFEVKWGDDWRDSMMWNLKNSGFMQSGLWHGLNRSEDFKLKHITVRNKDGDPLDWSPADRDSPPGKEQFPLRFEDQTHTWTAILWRGDDSNRDKLFKINSAAMSDIGKQERQFPVMLGAQQGALENVDEVQKQQLVDSFVKIFEDAELFDASLKPINEFVSCIVGSA